MGKEIKNPIHLYVTFSLDGGGSVVSSVCHYGISSEHDISARRDIPLTFDSGEQDDLVDTLNDDEIKKLAFALLKTSMVLNLVVNSRRDD